MTPEHEKVAKNVLRISCATRVKKAVQLPWIAPAKPRHYTLHRPFPELFGVTMPLSAVIVDDEQLARDELAYLLKNTDDVSVVAQGKNGLEALSLIKEHN